MGAGAVKGEARGKHPGQGQPQANTQGQSSSKGDQIMSCENCSTNFTMFKRKRTCAECGHHHCSSCLIKEPSSQRRCKKCRILSSGNFTRHDLVPFKIKDLSQFLSRKNIPTNQCTERNDLIELVLRFSNSSQYFREQEAHRRHLDELQERYRQNEETFQGSPQPTHNTSPSDPPSEPQSSSDPPSTSDPPSSDSATTPTSPAPNLQSANETQADRTDRLRQRQEREMREAETRLYHEFHTDETPDTRLPANRMTLEQVEEGRIEDLTVRQLKEILATNYVDFKGCVEKYELIDRVKRLWEDSKKNKEKAEETGLSGDDAEMCKICMDAVIDSVLLECGHMVTCTKCGKRLSECPICRQYVIRVVHTFKA